MAPLIPTFLFSLLIVLVNPCTFWSCCRHLDETSLKWVFSCLMVVTGARTVVAARAASVASAAAVAVARRV